MPQDIFSFAIIAGVIIQATGLIVVIYQLSRLNLSIRVTAQSAVYQQASDARSYLIQFPELRKYFFDSEAIEKTSPDYDRVRTIAELFLNYMEHLILQQGSLRTSDWNAWKILSTELYR
jgi:hypothetical protein